MQIHAVVKRHENIKSDQTRKRQIRKKQIRKKNEQIDANRIRNEQIDVNDLFKRKYIFLTNII